LKRCFTVGATGDALVWQGVEWQLCRRTLGVEQLLLRGFLLVDGAELEAERLGVVLGARDPHDGGDRVAIEGLGGDDGVLVELILEQGADASNDAHAHGGCRGVGGQKLRRA
jgi:hypothetical protein